MASSSAEEGSGERVARPYRATKGSFSIPRQSVVQRMRDSQDYDDQRPDYSNVASFFDSERLADAQRMDDMRRPKNPNPGPPPPMRWPFLGSIRSFGTSQSTRTPQAAESQLLDSEKSPQQDIRLPWRPFFLRRRVLIGFAILFAALIAGLEVALFLSNRNNGLGKSTDAARYLWQYGSTLVFVVVALVWARVEYQSKLATPWIRLSRGPVDAKQSLLLDYISEPEGWTVVNALRNRDYIVAGPVAVGIVLKIVIVLATALITPRFLEISNEKIEITLAATFSDSNAGLGNLGSLPYFTMAGVQTSNMSLPDGISTEAAYQPFSIPNWSDETLNATVDGFLGGLGCQEASMSLGTVRYTGRSGIELNLTVTADECTSSQMIQTTRFARETDLAKKFLFFQPGSCDGSVELDDQRIVAMTGRIVIDTDALHGSRPGNARIDGTLIQSTALICTPNYAITRMQVVKNAADIISTTSTGDNSRTIDAVHPWDIAQAQFNSFENHKTLDTSSFTDARAFYDGQAILDADEPMYAALAMRARESGAPPDLTSLQDGGFLETFIQEYYDQFSAIVARFALMEDASTSSTATASMVERRVIMREIPAHIMAGFLGVCLLTTVGVIFITPKHGFLPRGPGSIIDIAALLVHSRPFLHSLQGYGGAANFAIKEKLGGAAYSTGLESYAEGDSPNLGYFHVSGGNGSVPTTPVRNGDSSMWRQPVALTGIIRLLFALILAGFIIGFEVSLRASQRFNGLRDFGSDTAFIAWTAIPAFLLLILAMYLDAVDSWTRIMTPFTNLYNESGFCESMGLNLVDQWKFKAWWKAFKMRDFGVLSIVSGALFASLLVVASAALFEPASTERIERVALSSQDFFADSLAFSDDDPICTDCNDDMVAASLILVANSSYPAFTFEDLNIQTMSFGKLDLVDDELKIRVTLPAIRPKMTCRLYSADRITTNLTVLAANDVPERLRNPLRIDLEDERCRGRTAQRSSNVMIGTTADDSGSSGSTFFGTAQSKANSTAQCSDWLYVWGELSDPGTNDASIKSVGALACNESIVAVETEVVLAGRALRVDATEPPTPDERTVKNTTVAIPQLNYSLLANVSTSDIFDTFFALLTESGVRLSAELLGDSSTDAAEQIQAAILGQHGIIRAQSLNFKSRRHLSSAGTFPVANGTLIRSGLNPDVTVSEAVPIFGGDRVFQRIRLRQDVIATRILQCLLGVVLLLHLFAWIFTPQTILPRWPTSIASVAAFISDGNILGYLPRVAEWQSKQELETIFHHGSESMQFDLRWDPPWRQTKQDRRSRRQAGTFGIRVMTINEVIGEEVTMQPIRISSMPRSIPIGIRRVASSTVGSSAPDNGSVRSRFRPVMRRKGSAQGSAKAWWA